MNMQRRMDRLEASTLDATKRVRVIFEGIAPSPILPTEQVINVHFISTKAGRHG